MALQIGGGISFGGGISIVPEVPPAADLSGTITVGFNNTYGDAYGYTSFFPTYGSVSTSPAALAQLMLVASGSVLTRIYFNGTTIGTTPTDSMTGLASGVTSLSVTVDGVTQTLTTGGPSPGGYSIAGDPFSLATKNGQTLSLAIYLR